MQGPKRVFARNPATEARVWAAPGDKDYIYRVGGIEKDIDTGNISYESDNHQLMTDMRSRKVSSVADFIPDQILEQGSEHGLAVLAWGSTYGSVFQAVKEALREGYAVAQIHLRYINPLPKNLGALLAKYDRVLVPELNTGQLATLLRDKLLVDCVQLNQVNGQPFAVEDVKQAIYANAGKRMKEVSNG